MADETLFEDALGIVVTLTKKLEQAASRDTAEAYIKQLNLVHGALLVAIALQREVNLFREAAASNSQVASSSPRSLGVAHAIDTNVLRRGNTNDISVAIAHALDTTALYVAKEIIKEAGVRGGFLVNLEPSSNVLRVMYTVGLHHVGGKSIDDVMKDVGAIISKLRAT